MPLILSGNVASATAGAYDVANSCRFNDGDSAYMHKTPSAGNRRTFTFSAWIKRGQLSSGTIHLFQPFTDANNYDAIIFDSADQMIIKGLVSGSATYTYKTNQKFRDSSAWYHIVVAFDTTDGTAGDRIKLYVNGTEVTSFETETNPDQDLDTRYNLNVVHAVGANGSGAEEFDGYMAEVCFIEGSQLAASSFGEFDEDSPTIWKPIDVSGLTFGTNGFYLDFEASDNLGNDANGGTDLTEVNLAAADQATDTPTNNFATMNPLHSGSGLTFAEGNLQVSRGSSTWYNALSTFAPTSGKWYVELKVNSVGTNGLNMGFANFDLSNLQNLDTAPGEDATSAGLYSNGGPIFYASGTTWATVGSPAGIMQLAWDIDNGYLYWGDDDTWLNSGDPESGSDGTGGLAISNLTAGGSYGIALAARSGGDVSFNFGNPPYANSSSNADADGYGDFEYAVPSGYFALNSKNLAEYG